MNPRLKFFVLGIVLTASIFLILGIGGDEILDLSSAFLLVVIYLLWMGVKMKYFNILGILTTAAILGSYFLFTAPLERSLSNFSSSLIVIFTLWFVILFTYRQRELTLKEKKDKERLDAIFENATEGILLIDKSGSILMINKYAEELFGYSREELVGEKIEKLIPERFSSQHSRYREDFHRSPNSRRMRPGKELFSLHKDQHEIPVEVSLSYFNTENEITVIAFVTDITERKKAAIQIQEEREMTHKLNSELEFKVIERTRDLEVALENLEETNKNLKSMEEELLVALEKERQLSELKSRFVSTASHEFRTPLSTILSSVFLLENYSSIQLEQSKITHFQRIRRSVNNMTAILNDFLSISKLEEGRIKPSYEWVDIPFCIKEIVEEMDPVKKPDQQIKYVNKGSIGFFFIDKQFLRNILINLFSNAIKFSNATGSIEIFSRIEKDSLFLEIRDHGIGIPDIDQKHLFNRFFRASNAMNIEGTGLGLNIIKKYVDLMRGQITVESRLNEGTSFFVSIPASDIMQNTANQTTSNPSHESKDFSYRG